MARLISKARTLYVNPVPFRSPVTVTVRHRSSPPTKPQMMQIDLGEHEKVVKLFDDLIHRILVREATPDWLPFVPGSSFWVPPRPSFQNLTATAVGDLLTIEESLSVASLRGWPSSNFFCNEENASAHDGGTEVDVNIPEGMEGTVKVKIFALSENVALSEDEEG